MAVWQTAGKVRMTPKGTWSSSSTYEILDIVSNADQSASYVAKQSVPAGTALTNTNYWAVVASVGSALDNVNSAINNMNSAVDTAIATIGSATDYIAETYSSSDTYSIGEYVIHNGGFYRCISNISSPESWTSAHWFKTNVTDEFYAFRDGVVAVSTTQPTSIFNKIWVNSSADEVEVPTMDDLEEAQDGIDKLDSVFWGTMNGTNGLKDQYTPEQYIIEASGKWTTSAGRHIAIPVSAGDTITITQNSVRAGIYAALKTSTVAYNQNADFCVNTSTETWQERKVLEPSAVVSFIAPNDCAYLYIALHASNVNQDTTPKAITINGVDITYNIRARIDALSTELAQAKSEIPVLDNTLAISGEAADAKATGDAINVVDEKTNIIELEIAAQNTELQTLRSNVEKNNTAYDIWGLRSVNPGEYIPVALPSLSFMNDVGLVLLSDGYSFKPICDLRKNKNVSANTVRVTSSAELTTAISAAANGDTIVLAPGLYTPIEVNKPINLIGEDGVLFARDTLGQFVQTATQGIYRTAETVASEPTAVYDLSHKNDGIITQLEKKGTVALVVRDAGTWTYNNNYVYVHLWGEAEPTETTVLINNGTDDVIKSTVPTANGTIYLENITVFGGKHNLYAETTATYTERKIIAVDCQFICAWNNNNVALVGVDGFFQRCESMLSYRDGFNYHADTVNSILSNGLEIDCIGHDNGARHTGQTSPSENGSTIHDGGKIIRINGLYYNNNGGNVADTSPNGESYNYGCVAYDSLAPQADTNTDQTSADFWVKTGFQMHLYGCRALGNSQYNLRTDSNSNAIHVQNCEYTRTIGNIVPIT